MQTSNIYVKPATQAESINRPIYTDKKGGMYEIHKVKPVIAAIIEPMNRKVVEELRPMGEPKRMVIVDDDLKGPIIQPERLIIRAEENK